MNSAEMAVDSDHIRVVLIDDQQLFRTGIKALLGNRDRIALVGEAGNRVDALAVVQQEQPDIILLDHALKGESGVEIVPSLIAAAGNARVLVMSESRDSELARLAIQLGARGVVSKDCSFEILAKAIERVYEGEMWLDRSMTAAVLEDLARKRDSRKLDSEEAKIESLTGREREVIKAVGEGLKNKQIGERLFISDVTVHHHLTSIYSKLGVSDRLELVIYAYRHGLVPIPR